MTDSDEHPPGRRWSLLSRWWLRIPSILVLVAVLLWLGCGWAAWSISGSRARAEKAGLPMTAAEAWPLPADADNAAFDYARAFSALGKMSDGAHGFVLQRACDKTGSIYIGVGVQ